jgi:predicted Zn-dependent protease
VAVAVVAVVVLAWLGVMERDAREQARGVALAGVAGGAARADQAFRRATFLNPDTAPDVARAFTIGVGGDEARALRLLQDVLRREPDNLTAWGMVAAFARGRDPAALRRAFAARRRLDPLSAR